MNLPFEPDSHWTEDDARTLSLAQLQHLKTLVDEIADDLRVQIDTAKVLARQGDYSHPDWWRNVNKKAKAMNRKRQFLTRLIAAHRRAAKQASRQPPRHGQIEHRIRYKCLKQAVHELAGPELADAIFERSGDLMGDAKPTPRNEPTRTTEANTLDYESHHYRSD